MISGGGGEEAESPPDPNILPESAWDPTSVFSLQQLDAQSEERRPRWKEGEEEEEDPYLRKFCSSNPEATGTGRGTLSWEYRGWKGWQSWREGWLRDTADVR